MQKKQQNYPIGAMIRWVFQWIDHPVLIWERRKGGRGERERERRRRRKHAELPFFSYSMKKKKKSACLRA